MHTRTYEKRSEPDAYLHVVCWPTCAAGVLIVCGLIAIAQMFDLCHVAIDGRGGRRLAYNDAVFA